MNKKIKIFTDNIEEEAVKQIELLLEQKAFKDCKVRIMPDVHAGKGCVIGFTADLGDKVIPNIVGVDIGCGMLTVKLGEIDIDLEKFDNIVNKVIPSGRNIHEHKLTSMKDINNLYCIRELRETKKFDRSLGTLGGGNHFIEIDIDDENNKYLVIHTGSRNMGNQVARYYQDLAIQLCSGKEELFERKEQIIKSYKEQGRKSEIQVALKELEREYSKLKPNLPDDLCYLEGKYRDMYLHDMKICQEYASLNRMTIANSILEKYLDKKFIPGTDIKTSKPVLCSLKGFLETDDKFFYFETVHNYISFEDNIVRKGAISAKKGERVLIPINMRDGCIIGMGKGNVDWNESAPHGAGRLLSRTKAKEKYTLEQFQKSMEGIYSTSIANSTIDEAPFVYKPMQEIIDNIKNTVEIQKIIKPIYNFKGK